SKDPFETNPIISVNTMGQKLNKTIVYIDKEYIPNIIYPSYEGNYRTVKLNQDFNLEVSNLIPNTEIEIYHYYFYDYIPKHDRVKVDSYGKATLEFYGISNPNCVSFKIYFKYMKTKHILTDFTTNEIYIYKQLTLDTDKDSLYAQEGEEVHATLKGGKEGSKITWNIKG
ncbi:hypothetical protein L8U00_07770, partial [Campylobacter sp. IFREMER_LSEM_CL2256]|uniref:hypothetical protein n=1 Tax=Campylobacter sp. IFREMER_LSEM_CL2256 TaxID=2911622 RepID=UPI0021E7D17F